MMKTLFLLTISANSFAETLPLIKVDAYDHVKKASTIVEVLGNGKGSGVLVAMEGRAVIVTNSHNLQGKMSAFVNFGKRSLHYFLIDKNNETYDLKEGLAGFQGMAKVIYDFPLSDVAILELPVDISLEQKALARGYAYNNGILSKEKGWAPNESLGYSETIGAYLQGKAAAIDVLEGYVGTTVPDTFISGDENPVWAIPIFAKPGVSGGGYYKRGVLSGLVTKISLAGEPIAFATPFTKIAKLIYSPSPMEKFVSWKNGLMVYEAKDKTVMMNPLGNGGIGNGGELTEIDESLSGDSNPNYWRLQVNTLGGNRVITTWDPFVYRPGHFKVNNESVSFIKVTSKSLFKTTEKFTVPTLAAYVANEQKGAKQTLLQNTTLNLAILKEARQKQKTNINYGRLYQHDYQTNQYSIYNLRYGNDNGAQLLKPMSKDRWAKPVKWNKYRGPKPLFDLDAKVTVDEQGYFSNMPFSTKISDSTIFDIRVSGEFLGIRGTAYLTASTGLTEVNLKLVDKNEEKEIVLNPIEFNSPNSLVFKSDDGAYKVIYIYGNEDLTRLARIYIVSEHSLIELWEN